MAAKKLVFEVLGAQWNEYAGGVHEVEDPDPELVALVHAAEAADIGVSVQEWNGAHPRNVESQEDSEKAYAKAQKDGRWREGHLQDVIAQGQNECMRDDEIKAAGGEGLDEESRTNLELRVTEAQRLLAEHVETMEKKK